ncbi:TetR/AcrR family transcriptional regulator [Fusobacterium perfoetens]|uniref:TetR/AcrR family transcriptional regulator n=1 Tax=Fusobacterium perfoetens TaxID=852 RepID=UPI000488CD51|nr:TetR/AcrR family transcriptional regulator [Fusobacterium perfoetens]MCI6152143.1 TetR/AcrR family transcriptional regulator [Fusobacterium perfoetens]MDY3237966.1 TetR/AcrR family transcriptional regulator [Fusobacterium perfoetens]
MPKKVVFKKEIVFSKAFEMFEKYGLDFITARNLAKELKASPAPIYSNYESIDELKEELISVAKNRFMEYIKKPFTEYTYLNIGMGICVFARENKELFTSIFLREQSFTDLIRRFRNATREEIEKDERFKGLPTEFKEGLLMDCWIFAHGYSTLIATGYVNPTNDEIKERLLSGAGTMIYSRLKETKGE